MKIQWNKVTSLSQILAIIIFVAVFFVGFFIGKKYENKYILKEPINSAIFTCAENKTISTNFYENFVEIKTDTIKKNYLPQTISASGARYSNKNGSFVFWNKGDTAFITEGDENNITYKECMVNIKK
jgi:membrane-bound inhibitor of C-type lysozyme